MIGETSVPLLMKTVYHVPENTEMLAHRTMYAIPGPYRLMDYVAIVSTHAVTYTDADVIMDPEERECRGGGTKWGLQNSAYFEENSHWGFSLPENEKGVGFILVHRSRVTRVDVPPPAARITVTALCDDDRIEHMKRQIAQLGKYVGMSAAWSPDDSVMTAKKYLQDMITQMMTDNIDRKIMQSYQSAKGVIITP